MLKQFGYFPFLMVCLFISWRILEIPGEQRAESLLILFGGMWLHFYKVLKDLKDVLSDLKEQHKEVYKQLLVRICVLEQKAGISEINSQEAWLKHQEKGYVFNVKEQKKID